MSAKPGSKKMAGEALEALAMLDNVGIAFLTVDGNFRVTYANRIASGFFGSPVCGHAAGSMIFLAIADITFPADILQALIYDI